MNSLTTSTSKGPTLVPWDHDWRRRPFFHGRRSAFLLLFGVMYMFLGWGYTNPVPSNTRSGLVVATEFLPLHVWGMVWIVTGFVAAWASLTRRDAYGFFSLCLMPSGWAVAYFFAAVLADHSTGLRGAAVFSLLVASVAIVAGMVDPNVVERNAANERGTR